MQGNWIKLILSTESINDTIHSGAHTTAQHIGRQLETTSQALHLPARDHLSTAVV